MRNSRQPVDAISEDRRLFQRLEVFWQEVDEAGRADLHVLKGCPGITTFVLLHLKCYIDYERTPAAKTLLPLKREVLFRLANRLRTDKLVCFYRFLLDQLDLVPAVSKQTRKPFEENKHTPFHLLWTRWFTLAILVVSKKKYKFFMQQEFETQVINIDEAEIRRKLAKLGAKAEPEKFHRRWVYDINPNGCSEWVRLRTDGKKTTLCYKLRKDHTPTGTQELEVEVKDFEKTHELLSQLHFYCDKFYQENKSQIFKLDDIEFKIDHWPKIPALLEIEAKSEAGVAKGLEMLGLTEKNFGHHGHVRIYKEYGIELHEMKNLRFEK